MYKLAKRFEAASRSASEVLQNTYIKEQYQMGNLSEADYNFLSRPTPTKIDRSTGRRVLALSKAEIRRSILIQTRIGILEVV